MNKITVKCPKCRLRFEVPGVPGINEVQCNCPRCGMPFTYKVEDELNNSASKAPAVSSASAASTSTASTVEHSASAVTPPPIPHTQQTPPPPPTSAGANGNGSSLPPKVPMGQNIDNARAKRGCMIKALQAIILAGFIGWAVYYCSGSSKSYTSDSVELTNDSDAGYAASEEVDDAEPAPAYEDSTKDERAPEWIQGTWHVNTDYGGITLRIHGEQVAETSVGETVYGHYRYQNHRLYCDFGAGDGNNDHVYTLKMDAKQIDAGAGLLMKKLE